MRKEIACFPKVKGRIILRYQDKTEIPDRNSLTKGVIVNAEAVRGLNLILVPAQIEANVAVTACKGELQTETGNAT